jgi:hypothetical protein
VRRDLLRWQLDGYPEFHRNRTNLWIHIVAVPAFLTCLGSLVVNLCLMRWPWAAGSLVGMVVAFGAQGAGHGREATPAIPFDGPADAVTRIFAEQLVTFPRFVLGGGFRAALRQGDLPRSAR